MTTTLMLMRVRCGGLSQADDGITTCRVISHADDSSSSAVTHARGTIVIENESDDCVRGKLDLDQFRDSAVEGDAAKFYARCRQMTYLMQAWLGRRDVANDPGNRSTAAARDES